MFLDFSLKRPHFSTVMDSYLATQWPLSPVFFIIRRAPNLGGRAYPPTCLEERESFYPQGWMLISLNWPWKFYSLLVITLVMGTQSNPNQCGMKGNQGHTLRGLLEKVFLADKKRQRRRNNLPAFGCSCVTLWGNYLAAMRQVKIKAEDGRADNWSSWS